MPEVEPPPAAGAAETTDAPDILDDARPLADDEMRDEHGNRIKRPVIEKVKADEEIIIPEGHERGEVMSFGQKIVYELTWLLSVSIAKSYFRATVKGRENVPKTGAFIVSPVHRSNLDSPLIALVTRRRMRYMLSLIHI